MAEPTLSLGFPDLQKEVGDFLGFGPTSGNWSAAKTDIIERIIQSGIRQFYFPPSLGGGMPSHNWRFLKPVTTLATVASTDTYTLPDSFGRMEGNLTFASADNAYTAIKLVGEGVIRNLQQRNTSATGKPRYAAVRPKASTGSTGQRFEILLWPTPDAVYTLTYKYAALLDKITASLPYPVGGMPHAETILESCLAVAEMRKDDEKGLHWTQFMERLAASVEYDKQINAEFFGYNGDGSSDMPHRLDRADYIQYNSVTYP